ncbi:MAG: metal-dependent hydrolase [Saprospiraceae bacterium]|nr:metal-dependent hydrolase [Saprospiraceae bacterium]
MDSISQFVLGAAVGEAVLGKKIGNRAMILGGIGGTIPDLDVFANPFMTEVEALAFHRGVSHSITFAIIGCLLFGWLAYRYSNWRWHGKIKIEPPGLKSYQWMFFLAIFTHALLDTFTMYGTQLFAPFTNYRAAFSTISVADPMYTLPFLICLIIAAFYDRKSKKRKFWNWVGIVGSCSYLLFTIANKAYVNNVFESQLEEQGIAYERIISGPTILNNILWSSTVETEDVYYQGQYSLFDKSPIDFRVIKKNHELLKDNGDKTIETLKWFTHGFYNIIRREDGQLQFNDLRYGTFRGSGNGENDYVFRFVLDEDELGNYKMLEAKGGPEPGDEKKMMSSLWDRLKGN